MRRKAAAATTNSAIERDESNSPIPRSKERRKKPPPLARRPTKQKLMPKAVFQRLFTEKSVSSGSFERTLPHSWLYTMLNPRSNQLPAVVFKTFTLLVIAVDLIFFIVSTDPKVKDFQIFFYAEGVTSSIFLLDYLARLYTVIESRHYRHLGSVQGRLKYIITTSAIIDALATFPFFIELATELELPTLTYLRIFRLLRMLKTQAFFACL